MGLLASEFFVCVRDALGYNLSNAQQSAITTNPKMKVTQIVAGPGAGKTEVLALRVIYEIMVRDVESKKIIVTTFTKKAAEELTFRLADRAEEIMNLARRKGFSVVEPNIQLVRVGTIHSLCDELLTDYDSDYVEKGLQLIDEKDARMRLMRYSQAVNNRIHKNRMESLIGTSLRIDNKLLSLFRPPWKGIQGFEKWPTGTKYSFDRAGFLLDVIGMASETSLPRSVGVSGKDNGLDFQTPSSENYTEVLEIIPDRWLQHLEANHSIDFTMIQVLMWRALTATKSPFTGEFDHVFVDEFQDTNPIQLAIHSRWPAVNTNCLLTVVGDEDQSMYRFRGSDISCFTGLPDICKTNHLSYECKFLELNYRSTPEIVKFSQAFRFASGMHTFGNEAFGHVKQIKAPPSKKSGKKVRAILGSKVAISQMVANEIASRPNPEENAILMFSTKQSNESLPSVLFQELENKSLRVHNPTAKMAWQARSDMRRMLAALVYFFDPSVKNGRAVFSASRAKPRGKLGGTDWSMKSLDDWDNYLFSSGVKIYPSEYGRGGILGTSDRAFRYNLWSGLSAEIGRPEMKLVRDYLDVMREKITKAISERDAANAKLVSAGKPKLKGRVVTVTIGNLIYRILAHSPFNNRQFDHHFLRQVLFTQLFDANVSSTRLTKAPLDNFIWCEKVSGKIRWPAMYWNMLEVMHRFCNGEAIADLDTEAFQSKAVPMMTFHASKGLEFKHVYVARTGRSIPLAGPLRAKIFSGEPIEFDVIGGHPQIKDKKISNSIRRLGKADRDREVYVAMTRAEDELTFLVEEDADFEMDRPHEILLRFLKSSKPTSNADGVKIYEFDSDKLLSEFIDEVN
ncbi:ATP-dependent helicase [Candidatus Poseidoniales archaeon]|nr:ATP-dependent helicase [Candidatus Poseidoniales archaeon]